MISEQRSPWNYRQHLCLKGDLFFMDGKRWITTVIFSLNIQICTYILLSLRLYTILRVRSLRFVNVSGPNFARIETDDYSSYAYNFWLDVLS